MKQRRQATAEEAAMILANPKIGVRELATQIKAAVATAFRIKNEVLNIPCNTYKNISARDKRIEEAKPKFERPPAVYSNQRTLYNY